MEIHASSIKTATAFTTLNELLLHRAAANRHKTALIILDREGNESGRISYGKLISSSIGIAASISRKARKGDRCMLIFPPGLAFVQSLLACFFAGVVAVPVHPPKKNKKNTRFWSVFDDANPNLLLIENRIEELFTGREKDFRKALDVPRIVYSNNPLNGIEDFTPPPASPADLIMLQYTSGTTGKPAGTMITHAGIMHNSKVISTAFGHDEKLVSVNWLPPYHDMGLIGTLLQPLYKGGTNVIIDPYDFLRSPLIWLQGITKYKATTVGCPDFALELLADRIDDKQKKSIDLRSLKVFFCGSEPVRPASLEKFSKAFAVCGFEEKMFLPCYGLAECTLMATGIHHAEKPKIISIDRKSFEYDGKAEPATDPVQSMQLTACGYPWLDDVVKIVNPHTRRPYPENTVGEIWIRSKSVCEGYRNKPRKTARLFRARIAGSGEGPFLRTGDLGFISGGQLFIAGRMKEVIIINGANHFPADIESTVEQCHPALQPHACAAFSFEEGKHERLVIVQEIKRTALRNLKAEAVVEAIRSAVSNEHEIPVYAIELIGPGRIIRTSSGKIRHARCREIWMKNEFQRIYSWKQQETYKKSSLTPQVEKDISPADLESWLRQWLANKLDIQPDMIDPSSPILSYGLDSLGAVELEREVKENFGIEIHLADFLENNTIRALAEIGFKNLLKETG
jgi:acyl-CoA synthetase (AMP-forming)/AMP-acid ligase II/acyl carrier protein